MWSHGHVQALLLLLVVVVGNEEEEIVRTLRSGQEITSVYHTSSHQVSFVSSSVLIADVFVQFHMLRMHLGTSCALMTVAR